MFKGSLVWKWLFVSFILFLDLLYKMGARETGNESGRLKTCALRRGEDFLPNPFSLCHFSARDPTPSPLPVAQWSNWCFACRRLQVQALTSPGSLGKMDAPLPSRLDSAEIDGPTPSSCVLQVRQLCSKDVLFFPQGKYLEKRTRGLCAFHYSVAALHKDQSWSWLECIMSHGLPTPSFFLLKIEQISSL